MFTVLFFITIDGEPTDKRFYASKEEAVQLGWTALKDTNLAADANSVPNGFRVLDDNEAMIFDSFGGSA